METFLLDLFANTFLINLRPSSLGMLGYRPTTSIEQIIDSSGQSGRSLSFLRKSLVSFIYDLISWQYVSTDILEKQIYSL